MATNEVQRCMKWLFDAQEEMERQGFGKGRQEVLKALAAQKAKAGAIHDFRANVDTVMSSEKITAETQKDLNSNYNSVEALSKKREQCMDIVSQISNMEELIQGLSSEFDCRAQHLVSVSEARRHQNGPTTPQSNESMARASQTCVQAVRANWQWMFTVLQCAEVHLRNAAAYHEFFHEVDEAEHWMDTTLSRIHLSFDRSRLQGDRTDAITIMKEIKDVLAAFLQWQTKIDYLFDRSKEVVPVPLRTTPLKEERPAIALTDYYADSKLFFIEGEALYLMDNSDRNKWKVRNHAGDVAVVPAVIILIPGPYGAATDAAIRLRLQLLSLWTSSVKRLGYQIIAFMLLVFRDWNDDEVTMLQQLSARDKAELARVLRYIEMTLRQHWHEYSDFHDLQERINRLHMIIEEAPESEESNHEFLQTIIVQIKTLEDLLRKYKDFWAFWETYKTIVELIKQPEFLLVCDKWEQLRFITTAHFVRFWETQLDVADGELIQQSSTLSLGEAPSAELTTEITDYQEHEELTSERVVTSLTEEEHTYIIKSVLDPRDNMSALDFNKAILLGVVDQAKGLYVNPLTGVSMTLQEAMSTGRVITEFVSKKKLREEKQSYGLLTITVTRESVPYTIISVVNPTTKEVMTVADAKDQKILDPQNMTYRTQSGDLIPIHDAIANKEINVEYHEPDSNTPQPAPIVDSKTYAVHGVVDQQRKTKVTFNEAIKTGLLDKNTGEYLDNVTGKKYGVQEAIMKGFLKARLVTDPSKLEVDPRNTIVVEKSERAKKKFQAGVKAIKMFKSLGKPI